MHTTSFCIMLCDFHSVLALTLKSTFLGRNCLTIYCLTMSPVKLLDVLLPSPPLELSRPTLPETIFMQIWMCLIAHAHSVGGYKGSIVYTICASMSLIVHSLSDFYFFQNKK